MSNFLAIGLMSASADEGISAALVETDGDGFFRSLGFHAVPYTPALRDLIANASALASHMDRPAPEPVIDEAEHIVTMLFVEAVHQLLRVTGVPRDQVNVVGFRGHPLVDPAEAMWSWEIGKGALLAGILEMQVADGLPIDEKAADAQDRAENLAYTAVRRVKLFPITVPGASTEDASMPPGVLHQPKAY
jgi:anhydro-N-acetylmuramic acid kinase